MSSASARRSQPAAAAGANSEPKHCRRRDVEVSAARIRPSGARTARGTGESPAEARGNGKRTRIALGHRDHGKAKATALTLAAKLQLAEHVTASTLTLGTLFDNYMREVTPRKGPSAQQHDRAFAEMFVRTFGPAHTA